MSEDMANASLVVHPAEFWAAAETIARINRHKLCLAESRGDCHGQIVEAHTIPRSQLAKIAIDGHVYGICATAGDLLKNQGHYSVERRGIGQFSVLNFFCAKHDRQLFLHLENDDLNFDAHQLALLHCRAMGAELHKKMAGVEGARYNVKRAREQGRRQTVSWIEAYLAGSEIGLRDMTRTFSRCEAILRDETYTKVGALIVQFKKMPTIMAVGGFSPEFDYDGQSLQRLGDGAQTYDQIGLSILAAPEGTALAFTWLAEAKSCRNFALSFLTQRASLYSTLAIQTCFEHLENTCMNIAWWDSLLPVERETLLRRMQLGGSPTAGRTSRCLQYCGITFDQWDYNDHRLVGAA